MTKGNIRKDSHAALKKFFGFDNFRANQEEIITEILNGNNVIAVLPTGAGKSLCYQLPALIADNFSIVISPLIALMKDQVDSLNKNGEIAAFINSSTTFTESEQTFRNISYGKFKLLYVAPERLETAFFAERIKQLNPSYLFVDEAHCISEWGHNFRPSYRKIREFAEFIAIKNISAFTATATPEVVRDISDQLGLKEPLIFVRGFERDNLGLNVLITKRKKEKCFELISMYKTPAIIYTASRKKAEEVSEFLNLHRITCAYYHAGLTSEIRRKIQEDFINGEIPVIAATNAFGMGIDKKDIRLVIHYNMPGSIENYYQEIGRAGRDGNFSSVFLLHEDEDVNIQNFFISNSYPDRQLLSKIYDAICDYGKIAVGNTSVKEIPVNYDYISAYAKKELSKGIIYSSLNILESGGYLKQISEYEKKVSVQIILDKNKLKQFVLNSTNNTIREILLLFLREYGSEIFLNKITISPMQIGQAMGLLKNEVEEVLTTLDNLGIIIFRNPLSKENVILTSPRINSSRLVLEYSRINSGYLYQQKKLDEMVNYIYTDNCRFKYILSYFGENVESYKCGRCDNCLNNSVLHDDVSEYLKEIILRTLYMLTDPVTENVLLSILKGSDSAVKFSKLDTFSNCRAYDRDEIKYAIQKLLNEKFIEKTDSKKKFIGLTIEGINYIEEKEPLNNKEPEPSDYEENLEVFNFLNEIRKKASKKFLQAGNLICPDNVLKEIAIKKPKTKAEILSIAGFSTRMFNKIGEEIIEALVLYMESKKSEKHKIKGEIPQNIIETRTLLMKGYKLREIASLRKLNEAVISMQIETILEYSPETVINHLFEQGELERINDAINEGFTELKALKSKIKDEVGYPLLRIALAKAKNRVSS